MDRWVISCRFCDYSTEIECEEPPVLDTPTERHIPPHTAPGQRQDVLCPGSDTPAQFEGHPHPERLA